jgi:peptidoglycan hydrolase-like protein with peptidoglycan-binding domain
VIRLGDGVGFGCESVRRVQELLTSNGYPVPADGEFGPGTETAVRAYQADNDLDVDGLVGPATWDILSGFAGDY